MADEGQGSRGSGEQPVIGPPPAHIVETEVKGDISLYDPEGERALVLNRTASDVWLLCDGEQTREGIVELLAAAYHVDPAAVAAEVHATIDQFIEEGVLPAP